MTSLRDLNRQDKATILMVTHDALSASFYQEILDVVAAMGGDTLEPGFVRR